MSEISVVDIPFKENKEKNIKDTLETKSYAEALSSFIQNCGTPLTIGVQGEWGSGKTSLLNMIQDNLLEASINQKKKRYGGEYRVIWINTWEHSVLKSPEESLISILEELVDTISAIDGSFAKAQKAKQFISQIAKGALRVGAQAALGSKAAQVTEEVLGGSSNSIKGLRNSLEDIITTIIKRKENPVERFVIFVDDLDRIDPKNAVEVLELLKNIFSVENCVYVLAIDYQVVVKGLQSKFGELTEDNEWEFRAYFDKIIQLPFMMPMGSYNLQTYLEDILVQTNFYTKKSVKNGPIVQFVKAIRQTIGNNPRALKRLANSLSIINIHWNIQKNSNNNINKNIDKLENKLNSLGKDLEKTLRESMFCLVCMQISFPKVFQLLQTSPNFTEWDEEFVNKITKGAHDGDKEIEKELSLAIQHNSPDFDEEWEQSLFKIVRFKKWQTKRLVDTSRVLSIIKDNIIGVDDSGVFTEIMETCIKITSVTSVNSTSESLDTEFSEQEEELDLRRGRVEFWNLVKNKISRTDNLVGKAFKDKKGDRTSSGIFTRSANAINDSCYHVVSYRSSYFIAFTVEKHLVVSGNKEENIALFRFLRSNSDSIENTIKSKLKFIINEDSEKQEIRVICNDDSIPQRCDVSNKKISQDIRDKYIKNMIKTQPLFEKKIEELCLEFNHLSSNDREALTNRNEATNNQE